MGQSRPLFSLFSSFSHYNFNNTNGRKRGWCAWDSNPWPHDGRQSYGGRPPTSCSTSWLSKNVPFLKWPIDKNIFRSYRTLDLWFSKHSASCAQTSIWIIFISRHFHKIKVPSSSSSSSSIGLLCIFESKIFLSPRPKFDEIFSIREFRESVPSPSSSSAVWPDWAIYWTLDNFSKP